MTSQQLRKKGMLESEISKAFTQWEKIPRTGISKSKNGYCTKYDYRSC